MDYLKSYGCTTLSWRDWAEVLKMTSACPYKLKWQTMFWPCPAKCQCLWLLVCSLPSLDADCTYPVQWTTSTFYDNAKGPVTFSGNTMEGWPVTLTTIQKTVSSWECYHRNESTIVSKYGLKLPSNNPCFYVKFFIAGNHL